MSSRKILTAATLAVAFSFAYAQGTPPQPATDPAVGAGQRSTQNTPMGDTGTPGGTAAGTSAGGTAAAGAGAAPTTPSTTTGSGAGAASMNSGATAGATTTPGDKAMASDAPVTDKTSTKKSKRMAKADRN